MIASGRVAYLARRAGDFGIGIGNGSGKEVEVDMKKIRQRKRDIVEQFRSGNEKRLKGMGVDIVMAEARFVGEKEVEVEMSEGGEKRRVSADKVFVNVGCRPAKPDIEGLDGIEEERILDSTSIQELGEVPRHLLVVGGGTIGLEFGQLFRRLGADVTIVQRGLKLLRREDDPEVAECLQKILVEDGIKVYFNSTVKNVSRSKDAELPIAVSILSPELSIHIKVSHILLATGRVPNTDSLDLSAAGIATTPTGHIKFSPTLETNVKGVYTLGDVKGGPAFTHVSYDDFRIIRNNLYSPEQKPVEVKATTSRAPFVPSITFTDPQFAQIGPLFATLSSSSHEYVSYSMPGSWIARGLETDEMRGMMKIVIDPETNRIISFYAIGTEAGEVMSVVQMAMLGGLTWMDLRDGIFAHPAWSEGLNNIWGGERKVLGGVKGE